MFLLLKEESRPSPTELQLGWISDSPWLGRGVVMLFLLPLKICICSTHIPPDLSSWGQEDTVLKSVSSLYLVCAWERLLCLRTSWGLVQCLKPPTYFKSLLSQMSTTSFVMIPSCVRLFRYAAPLPTVWQPSWTRLLLVIAWMLSVLCSQVDGEKIFLLNYKSSPHEPLMLGKNVLNSCDLEFH